jgi:predicted porin
VHVLGKVADGKVNYQVSVINGNGYKNPTRSKSVDVEGRVGTTVQGLTLGLGGYSGKLGKDVQGAVTHHIATRWDAIAGYKIEGLKFGAEYFSTKNWNSVTSVNSDSADGWSAFAAYAFTPQVSAFGRYDWVKKSSTGNPSVRDNYFNVGLQWEPTKIVDFALVYKRDEAKHGTISTSNGTIGGAGVNGKGTYDEFGVWGQYRW